ncbi:MAG TPA: zinc ribbon domain-containing protein [Holophaga sp.]|nr:zinc ribbon domain-containing protein [Holophaga sp.]
MNPLFFSPVLRALNQGSVLRNVTATILRLSSLGSLVGGIWLLVQMLKVVFSQNVPGDVSFAVLWLALFVLAAAVLTAQITWIRSDTVLEIPDGAYSAIPIISTLVRCTGEVYALTLTLVGLGGCGFIWIANRFPGYFLGPLGDLIPHMGLRFENNFLIGLAFLAYLLLMAFFVIMAFYFLAEGLVVLVDIARNTAAAARPTVSNRCPACGVDLQPGSRFCDTCGHALD